MANQHKTECSKFLIVTFSTLRPSLWQQCWKQSIQNKTIYFARNGNKNLAHGVTEVGVLYYKIKYFTNSIGNLKTIPQTIKVQEPLKTKRDNEIFDWIANNLHIQHLLKVTEIQQYHKYYKMNVQFN